MVATTVRDAEKRRVPATRYPILELERQAGHYPVVKGQIRKRMRARIDPGR